MGAAFRGAEAPLLGPAKYDQYDQTRPFGAWAVGVAKYEVLYYRRERATDKHLFGDDIVEQIASRYEILAEEVDPLRDALKHCLDKLEGRSKRVIELRYRRGLPSAAIADEMDLTAGAVRMLLCRVRDTLRRCIERRRLKIGFGELSDFRKKLVAECRTGDGMTIKYTMDNVSQLISDYLDGELDEAGVPWLSFCGSPAAVDQLVFDSFVHSQLHHWMNVRHLHDQILADAVRMNLRIARSTRTTKRRRGGTPPRSISHADSLLTRPYDATSLDEHAGRPGDDAAHRGVDLHCLPARHAPRYRRPAHARTRVPVGGVRRLPVGSLLLKGQQLRSPAAGHWSPLPAVHK